MTQRGFAKIRDQRDERTPDLPATKHHIYNKHPNTSTLKQPPELPLSNSSLCAAALKNQTKSPYSAPCSTEMNDSAYQSHFQGYSQHIDSTSAMQLAYYQSSQVEDTQSWLFSQQKASYDDSFTRMPVRSNSLLYPSEFADPNSNLELPSQELAMPYPAHSSSSGYAMASLEGTLSNETYHHRETVANASSHINPEPMYGSHSPVFVERQQQLDLPSEPFSHSWSTNRAPQASPNFADAQASVRYSPYTVRSQRPVNGQDIGTDTPPSPLSLSRSKHSSASPSPGPLTPAIGHISLQAQLCTVGLESRPTSSSSSRNLYGRNDEVDPDRPYPCSSCRMAFARQHDLTRHSRVHSGETPYYCHGCRQGFRRSDARSRHWGKDAQCLALHQRRVEGTEEGRKLQKSLLRLSDKVGRVGTTSFRVHKPPTRSMRGSGAQ